MPCFLKLLILSVSVFGFSISAHPNTDNDLNYSKALSIAQKTLLHTEKMWAGLLHARNPPLSPEAGESYQNFYLSAPQKLNLEKELELTLQSIYDTNTDNADNHGQCVYPARTVWLQQNISWQAFSPPKVNCSAYHQWAKNRNINSASLIYAAGYLENPASFYGHILLRLNDNPQNNSKQLLAKSIDYGAIVAANDNGLVYVLKGLFGGYNAGFSHNQFYQNNHNYGEDQLRDLWDYQLALDESEVNLLVAHTWELLGVNFKYYFFNENCASAMADILEILLDLPLYNRLQPWVIPSSIFNHLVQGNRNGKSLVTNVRYLPSRISAVHHKLTLLPTALRQYIRRFVTHKPDFSKADYHAFSDKQKQLILDVLIDYYQYRITQHPDQQEFKKHKQSVLNQQLSFSPHNNQWPNSKKVDIGSAQGGTAVRILALQQANKKPGLRVQLRPAYFDFLSPEAGAAAYSHLAMADTSIDIVDKKVTLNHFDLVYVETLNTSLTGLPGDGGKAWKIRLGVQRLNLQCDNCLIGFAEGGLGKAKRLSPTTVAYAMLDLRFQDTKSRSGNIATTPRLGIVTTVTERFKTQIEFGYRDYLEGSRQSEQVFNWRLRYTMQKNWELRAQYQYHQASEFNLGLSYYW